MRLAPADSRPLFIPRGLVMLASAWVFLGWISIFGFRPPVQPQAASYGPGIQMLMIVIGVGIGIGWPLLRLSGRPSSAPLTQGAMDGIAILVLLQVVVWPLRLVTSWTLPRTIALVAAMATAIFLVAALLAMAMPRVTPRARAAWMGIFCLLSVLPAWPLAEGLVPWSPPALLARFSEPSTIDPGDADRALLVRAIVGSTLVWLVSAAICFRRARARVIARDAGSTS